MRNPSPKTPSENLDQSSLISQKLASLCRGGHSVEQNIRLAKSEVHCIIIRYKSNFIVKFDGQVIFEISGSGQVLKWREAWQDYPDQAGGIINVNGDEDDIAIAEEEVLDFLGKVKFETTPQSSAVGEIALTVHEKFKTFFLAPEYKDIVLPIRSHTGICDMTEGKTMEDGKLKELSIHQVIHENQQIFQIHVYSKPDKVKIVEYTVTILVDKKTGIQIFRYEGAKQSVIPNENAKKIIQMLMSNFESSKCDVHKNHHKFRHGIRALN